MRNIEKSPQYDLYRLTKNLYLNKEKIVPENADMRCVKSTIINRAYYSSYLATAWVAKLCCTIQSVILKLV